MGARVDYLGKGATKVLAPFLKSVGFARRAPKTYFRIRGALIDVVGLNKGGWGNYYYVHYSVNLTADPAGEILSSYDVGDRLDGSDGFGEWRCDAASDVERSMEDVVRVMESKVIPWFDSIKGLEEYLIELHSKETVFSMKQILVLAMLGRTEESLKLCNERLDLARKGRFGEDEVTDFYIAQYLAFQEAVKAGRLQEFLDEKRAKNFEEEKIKV